MASEQRQEMVEDILREWRDMVCYHDGPVHPLNHGAVMLNLDRIEAAWKREAAILNAVKSDVEFLREFCDGRACKDCPFVDDYGCCSIDHIFKEDQK